MRYKFKVLLILIIVQFTISGCFKETPVIYNKKNKYYNRIVKIESALKSSSYGSLDFKIYEDTGYTFRKEETLEDINNFFKE